MSEKEKLNKITEGIIAGAIRVHKALGPGLLESAYEACTAFELVEAGHKVEQQKPLPLITNVILLKDGIRRVVYNFPD
jgi:GxxExxY protein